MAKQTVNIGSTANDGTGDQLRTAFNKLNQNNDEIYGNNFVTELMLNDDIVGAAELKVTGNGAAGQILKSDGDGTFSWIDNDEGDITAVAAGDGLTGGGTGGAVSLNVVGGTGITANTNNIALTDGGVNTTQLANNAVNATKLDVSGNGDSGQILTSDGDGSMTWITGVTGDVTGVAAGDGLTGGGTGGDVSLAVGAGNGISVNANSISLAAGVAGDGLTLASGVLSVDTIQTGDIADDAITSSKLANSINADIATGVGKTSFPGFGTSSTTALAGNTSFLPGNTTTITATQAQDILDNNAKFTNVSTNLGITGSTGARTITSSDGNNATIPIATTSVSGLLSPALFDEIDTNSGKTSFPGFGTSASTALAGNTSFLPGSTTTITTTQAQAITDNSAKTGITSTQALAIVDNSAKTGITTAQAQAIGINSGKTSNANHSGDVTGSTQLTIANNAVTHDKLENRYTAISNISTTSSTLNLNAASFAVFNITANLQSSQTLNIQNMKTGQVIDILATGVSTLTLNSNDSSEIFNNLGAVTYDGASNNNIQIICIDDTDSSAIYNYTISTYTADNTPN